MSEEEFTLKDEMKGLREDLRAILDSSKSKKFKLPRKAKVGKSKLKKGYISIMQVDNNKGITFLKEPICEGVVKLEDTFHAVGEDDVLSYKGKPFIIVPKGKLNPWNPLKGNNETYGQKLVMARMLGDAIKTKKGIGSLGWIIFIILVGGIVAYYFLSKKA